LFVFTEETEKSNVKKQKNIQIFPIFETKSAKPLLPMYTFFGTL